MISVKRTNVTLRAEYVGVTEAWLKLQTHEANCGVQIKRGNKVIFRTAEINKDTVVYDSTLLPAHTYNYALLLQDERGDWRKAQEVQITTMDTTSHDFQWEVIEFPSPYGSGALYDVAIINENNIWAVGEIYSDSAQPWLPYNAVHWDGSKWKLKRIFVEYRGQPNLAPLEGVFVLPNGQIIFSSGLPYLPERDHWKLYHLWDMGILDQNDGSVNRIWGTSINNLYFAGSKGTIVHYNGNSWQRIESGTELNINDIWGKYNLRTKHYEVLLVASNHLSDPQYRRKIFRIENNNIIELPTSPINWTLYSVWFQPLRRYYVAGGGIYEKINLSESYWHNNNFDITSYYIFRIRGEDINEVFAVGGFGEVLHFNGKSWKSFYRLTHSNGNYYSVSIYHGIVCAVGETVNSGNVIPKLIIGRRIK